MKKRDISFAYSNQGKGSKISRHTAYQIDKSPITNWLNQTVQTF